MPGRWDAHQIEDRRTEVDEADVLVYAPRFDGVMMKQERHTQQLIVEAPDDTCAVITGSTPC